MSTTITSVSGIDQVFIICDKHNEKERYTLLQEWLGKEGLTYTFHSVCYKNTLSTKMLLDFNLSRVNLRKSESSLMVNYFSLMDSIEKSYTGGLFLILESDVIPVKNWKQTLETLVLISSKANDFDFIHVGNGCNLSPTMFGHKIRDEPSIYMCPKARCTEAMIWSYEGIRKFNYLRRQLTHTIFVPLDFHFDELITQHKCTTYWSHPFCFKQGSQMGVFKSTIQSDPNPRDLKR